MTLLPGSGGIFDISLGGEQLFSKKAAGRFPRANEIEELLETRFGLDHRQRAVAPD